MESGELSQGSKLISAVEAARETERDRVCEALRKKAVRFHAERRVLMNGNRTVVFSR